MTPHTHTHSHTLFYSSLLSLTLSLTHSLSLTHVLNHSIVRNARERERDSKSRAGGDAIEISKWHQEDGRGKEEARVRRMAMDDEEEKDVLVADVHMNGVNGQPGPSPSPLAEKNGDGKDEGEQEEEQQREEEEEEEEEASPSASMVKPSSSSVVMADGMPSGGETPVSAVLFQAASASTPGQMRLKALAEKMESINNKVRQQRRMQSTTLSHKVSLLDSKLSRVQRTEAGRVDTVRQQVEELVDVVERERVALQALDERKRKELELVQANLALELDRLRQSRLEAEERVARLIDDKFASMQTEIEHQKELRETQEVALGTSIADEVASCHRKLGVELQATSTAIQVRIPLSPHALQMDGSHNGQISVSHLRQESRRPVRTCASVYLTLTEIVIWFAVMSYVYFSWRLLVVNRSTDSCRNNKYARCLLMRT